MKKLSSILLCGLILILSACEKDTESANFAPVVTTGSASDIYRMGATLSGSIQLTETNTAKEYGILVSSFESMAEATEYPVKDGSSNFSVQIQNLEPGETYYYCAYASSGYSTAKSQIKSFTTTNSNAPVFNEVILQSKDEKSCTVSVEILDEGGSDLLISGFVLGESGKGDPTATNNIKIQNVEPQGSRMSATFSGLEPNKTYLVRAYGINASGTGYSNSVSVTTNTATVPFLSDITRVDSTEVSVTVKASVLDAGLGEVTKYGFCYSSESKEPTTAHLVAENIEGDSKNFIALIENLNPETTYYFRAYAENEKGVGYSDVLAYTLTKKKEFGAVDLGLSVLWANFNLGATSSDGYGDYYAFGEISPKTTYTEANWIKPGTLYLPAEKDAATQQLGEDWRMPTKEEVSELLTECTWELITSGKLYVYKVTGKTGNFIILPLTGSWNEDPAERFDNYEARYRTSEAYLESTDESVDDPSTIVLELQKNFADTEVDSSAGWKGHPIRPVKGERKQEESGSDVTEKSITLTEAGTLANFMKEAEQRSIQKLTISGPINGDDIRLIREMAGRDVYGNETPGRLVDLDISEATIVEGGGAYYDIYYTKNDVVGYNMFEETILKQVFLPNSVILIDISAFEHCTSLTSINIPDGVTSIGDQAFWGCTSLTSIDIPNGVTEIGTSTFLECTALTSVTIGNSVTSIGGWAFEKCSSLASINIPDGVTSIGSMAFYGCSSLSEVYISDLAAWCKINFDGSESNPLGYAGKLYLNNKMITDLVIPNDIAEIKNFAFVGCTSLVSVVIPDGVTLIGEDAFDGCSSLTSIDIPDGVTSIGSAFTNCSSLTTINIPDGVTSIGGHTFSSCSSLTSITIPDGVTDIGEMAFYACNSLAEVTCNATTPPTLGNNAFKSIAQNSKLILPADTYDAYVATDWANYFATITDGKPHGEYTNGVATLDRAGTLSSLFPGDEKYSITKLKIIGSLNGVDIRLIREMAGRDVYGNETEGKLIDLDLSEATIVAGGGAYYITDNHSYICDDSRAKTIVDYMFYSTIIEKIVLPTNTIEIMNNAFTECKSLTSIIIPEATTLIGDGVFTGCSSLTSITIPDGVTSIGDSAFSRCSSLETIEIPESISIIASGLFNECKSLTNVILPNTITSIGSLAFWYCTSLKSIVIPEGVTSIGYYAFGSCVYLETINIPDGVTEIARGTFNDCYRLTSVVIPDGVISIGDYAFSQCDTFTNIDIPNGVVKIGAAAFNDCSNLSAVIIGNGVAEIGEHAFLACTKLSDVTCNATTPPVLGPDSFVDIASPATLYVPTSCSTAYSESDWAQYFTTIEEK